MSSCSMLILPTLSFFELARTSCSTALRDTVAQSRARSHNRSLKQATLLRLLYAHFANSENKKTPSPSFRHGTECNPRCHPRCRFPDLSCTLYGAFPGLSPRLRRWRESIACPLTPTADSLKNEYFAYSSVIAILLYTKANKNAIDF